MVHPQLRSLLLSLLAVTLVGAEGPQPGDTIDWSASFPEWWHDIQHEHETREVRK